MKRSNELNEIRKLYRKLLIKQIMIYTIENKKDLEQWSTTVLEMMIRDISQ